MVMTALTTADVRHFEKNLQRMRVELVAELDRLSGSLDDVREARDGTQDDEHDPEVRRSPWSGHGCPVFTTSSPRSWPVSIGPWSG